jgi:hypothetical protein
MFRVEDIAWSLSLIALVAGVFPLRCFGHPKISLLSLSEGHNRGPIGDTEPQLNLTFQNNTVFVVPAGVGEIILECSAPYPIRWNLQDSDVRHFLLIRH